MWLISHFSRVGDDVLSLYSGSGTTAKAALSMARSCISFEKDPIQARDTLQKLTTLFDQESENKKVELDASVENTHHQVPGIHTHINCLVFIL